MDSKADANELFVKKIEADLSDKKKHNKISIEKIATGFAIYNKNLIKELTELAIVRTARNIAQQPIDNYNKFQQIVELYNNQANLSMRTSQSMLLQQYSTPAPISYIASLFVLASTSINGHKSNTAFWNKFENKELYANKSAIEQLDDLRAKQSSNAIYFEPSAGNGLLTIALPYENTYVNELDDVRLANLRSQPFARVTNQDATIPFTEYYKKFDGITTNPPFGTLMDAENYDGFPIKTLDHLMALRALDTMKDTGRAAIIIGGHTDWDEQGRVQAGKNRLFFNYLYSHYYVEDIILVDGHKLYSRQGTSFNVRLILIRGRKTLPEGFAPLKNSLLSEVVKDFESLWNRVFDNHGKSSEIISILKSKREVEKEINYDLFSEATVAPTQNNQMQMLKLKMKMKAKALQLLDDENLSGFSAKAVGRFFETLLPNTNEKRIGKCEPEKCETLDGIKGHACCLLDGKCAMLKAGGCSIHQYRPRNCRIFPHSSDNLKLVKNCSYSFANLNESIPSALSGPAKRRKLSRYTIASNCTDKIDILDAIEEISEEMKHREIIGLKTPIYYFVRLYKLNEKLKTTK